jgi:hypothetical protein
MSDLHAKPAKNRSMRARFGLKKQTDAVPSSRQNEALGEASESRTPSLTSPQAHAQAVSARSASNVDADTVDIAEVAASPGESSRYLSLANFLCRSQPHT